MIHFAFELRPVVEIAPWTDGNGENPHLSWFGLTDGWYWIEIDAGQLFRYSDREIARWREEGFDAQRPYASYQVARIWEDIQQLLPAALEPVPADLQAFIAHDGAWQIDVEQDHRIDEAYTWHAEHELSGGHLLGPRIRAWRTLRGDQDNVTFVWVHDHQDGDDAWFVAPERGEVRISTDDFVDAVRSLDRRLLEAMGERVEQVLVEGIDPVVRLDPLRLREEQLERSTWLDRALASERATDWSGVRIGATLLMEPGTDSSRTDADR